MMVLESLDSERRRKWRQDVMKQDFCCLQMPGGPGQYLLPNSRPLRDSSWIKYPGFARGGMLVAGIDSLIKFDFI